MIDDAEARGVITPGDSVIVEPTSGNTGIALAMIGAARGYRVILTMPESMSIERRKLLRALRCRTRAVAKELGMPGRWRRPSGSWPRPPMRGSPGSSINPANPRAHYETTGPEIAAGLGELELGAFVAGVGTGGTISGVGRYLKERFPGVKAFAVEPAESPDHLPAPRRSGPDARPAPDPGYRRQLHPRRARPRGPRRRGARDR